MATGLVSNHQVHIPSFFIHKLHTSNYHKIVKHIEHRKLSLQFRYNGYRLLAKTQV